MGLGEGAGVRGGGGRICSCGPFCLEARFRFKEEFIAVQNKHKENFTGSPTSMWLISCELIYIHLKRLTEICNYGKSCLEGSHATCHAPTGDSNPIYQTGFRRGCDIIKTSPSPLDMPLSL